MTIGMDPGAGSWRAETSTCTHASGSLAHKFARTARLIAVGPLGWSVLVLGTVELTGCSYEDEPVLTGHAQTGGGGTAPPTVMLSVPSVEGPPIGALAEVGDTVGQFELAAPAVTPFTLHGTLPVPRGTFVAGSGTEPFVLVDGDGNATLAQVEVVTRYPDSSDGADVVEVIARVDRPATAEPGSMIRYDVRYQPHAPVDFSPSISVEALLAQENAIVLRTRDVFGHRYQADLYREARQSGVSLRTLKRGRVETQVATHQVLTPVEPVEGPQGSLPHHVGAHAYVTQYGAEDFVSLDLRVHNGFSGLDPATTDDNPLGKVYFESLELVVPAGWNVISSFDDPFLGAPYDEDGARVYPIVRAIDPEGSGALHMMPAMAQFHRRLAIAKDGSEEAANSCLSEEGLAFARAGVSDQGREWFSWWNRDTGRWFSQRQVLPSLAPATEDQVRGSLAGQFATLQAQIANGTPGQFPIESANMGWAHPWGINDGGMVSGSEIYLYDGVDVAWSASREGYRAHQLTHRMYADRQPNVLFNKDGLHTTESQWTVHAAGGDFLPIWWYSRPMFWAADPFGYLSASTEQVDAVAAAGRQPWYEGQLIWFAPIDLQHLIRYTRSPKVLVWLGNDAIAKEDICAEAEGFRIGYSALPQDLWGNIIPTGLLAMKNFTHAYPHNGLPFGRGESWGLDVTLAAYSVSNDAWRELHRPWLEAILDILDAGQTGCSNVIQATPQYNVFGSRYRCRQSIEAAIMENALVALRETAFLGVDDERTQRLDGLLRRAFYAMVSPLVWSSANHGPWAMMAVGPFDLSQPAFCTTIPSDGNYGYADHYQLWSSFAYAYEITHDPVFLQRAAEALGGNDFLSAGQANPLGNWQNKAAMTALAQQLALQSP